MRHVTEMLLLIFVQAGSAIQQAPPTCLSLQNLHPEILHCWLAIRAASRMEVDCEHGPLAHQQQLCTIL